MCQKTIKSTKKQFKSPHNCKATFTMKTVSEAVCALAHKLPSSRRRGRYKKALSFPITLAERGDKSVYISLENILFNYKEIIVNCSVKARK